MTDQASLRQATPLARSLDAREPRLRLAAPSWLRPESPCGVALRGVLYLVMLLGVLAMILWIAQVDDSDSQSSFRDGGLCESLQLVMLGMSATLFGYGAWQHTAHRRVFLVWAFVVLAVFTRELDAVLDAWLPLVGWQLPAGLCLGATAAVVFRDPARFWSSATPWLTTHAVGILWCAIAIILVFAQLIGQADLWKGVMGDAYERAFKRVVEESSEFFGYAVLLIGATECLMAAAWVAVCPTPDES